MGIDYHHAALLIREHSYKPLPETVHLIGRQTVRLTCDEINLLCQECGVTPVPVELAIDSTTRNAQASTTQYVTDTTFFKMLGVKNVYAIDHSDYEGAEIILNLNQQVPPEYNGIADFIYGGSVCDNVFDPAMYLRNMSRLLKPGGRLIDQNITTNHYHPYAMLPAIWYYDYFVINKFADCKVYMIECSVPLNFYGLEVNETQDITRNFAPRDLAHAVGIFLIAERGIESTIDVNPSQDQYRSAEEWVRYRANLAAIKASPRPYFPLFGPLFGLPAQRLPGDAPLSLPNYRYLGRLSRNFDGSLKPLPNAAPEPMSAKAQLAG